MTVRQIATRCVTPKPTAKIHYQGEINFAVYPSFNPLKSKIKVK